MTRIQNLNKPTKIVLLVIAALFVYALPLLNPPFLSTPDIDFGGVLFTCAAYALVALGLNIVIGYAGLLDLGYVGFYAVGAYTVGVLTVYHGSWPFFLVLPVAIVVTMISGVILGVPTLRVRGDYLAIVTLGFGEIIRLAVTNTDWVGASRGISNIPSPPSIPPGDNSDGLFEIPHIAWVNGQPLIDLDHKTKFLVFGVLDTVPFYWMILTALILVLIGDYLVKRSRVGRAWEATREDEDAAELMGVPTFKFKLLAFALGAFIGGLSGAMFATRQSHIDPISFPLLLSMLFVASVVIGGSGNRWGAMLGGVLVAYLPERFRDFSDWRMLVFGIALMAMTILRPQGLIPPIRTRRAKRAQQEIAELEGEESVA
ncbi:branched-chain amino acid ABC transporter permease [Nocardioides sp. KR10-350]|uniref:branched-chain amino acid ABC transporter permease n=1 Tax=Nocardioides cheoyonin TaxID=3156615 RepID=UPI0032B39B08